MTPGKRDEFQRRYRAEQDGNEVAVERCLRWCRARPVVLLCGAKDRNHNQTAERRGYLRQRRAREDAG